MKNIWRIFRKDVRHLWPQILVFLALAGARVFRKPFADSPSFLASPGVLDFLAAAACCGLVTTLVHEERLVGDRQYWLTRPIPWQSLLAAKAIFLLLLVNLPVLAFQAVALAAHDFPPVEYWPILLAKQVFLTAFLVLPAAALAAVSRDLARTMLTAVALALALVLLCVATLQFWRSSPDWGALAWISTSAIALVSLAGAALAMLVEYSRRKTLRAYAMLGATAALAALILTAPPWPPAFRLQQKLSRRTVDASVPRIVLDDRPRYPFVGPKQFEASVGIYSYPATAPSPRIPIRMDDLPDDLAVAGNWIRAGMDGPGVSWRSGWFGSAGILEGETGQVWLAPPIDAKVLDRVKDAPARLRVWCDLTLLERTDPRDAPNCRELRSVWQCLSASPEIALVSSTNPGAQTNAPYPASPSFGVLREITGFVMPGQRLVLARPVAYIERELNFPAIRLAEYLK